MTDVVSWQFAQLLIAVFCGMILGVFYDVYRLFRYFRAAFKNASVTDVIWWILAFLLIFGLWFYLTVGDISVHYLLWQLMGFIVFRAYFSRYAFNFGKRLVHDAASMPTEKFRSSRLYNFLPWLMMLLAKGIYQAFLFIKNSLFKAAGWIRDGIGFLIWTGRRFLRKVKAGLNKMRGILRRISAFLSPPRPPKDEDE